MRKLLLTFVASLLVTLCGAGLALAQDGSDVPTLMPIEIDTCSYNNRRDSDDYDKAMGMMTKWMNDNDSEPYAAIKLNPFFAGEQDFDFVYLGVWLSGTDMGKDMAAWTASAGDVLEAMDDAVTCAGASMFTSLNIMPLQGDAPDSFVLTVTDCNVAEGRSTSDAIGALQEYGEYRNATGSPGRMWAWFPTYGNGDEDFDFKLASSYRDIEAFGNNFQWNQDNQAYIKRRELFSGLLDCNVARSYLAETIVNTLRDN